MPTRINGATNDTAKWIPGTIIKPVVEVVESLLRKEASRSIVEVRIELVNNTLEA